MDRIEAQRDYLTNLIRHLDYKLDALLDDMCKEVVVRSYTDGCSSDDRRDSTDSERKLLRQIFYSAIYTFTHDKRADVQTIVDMSEIIAMKLLNDENAYIGDNSHINCYDTVYSSLQRLFGVWG